MKADGKHKMKAKPQRSRKKAIKSRKQKEKVSSYTSVLSLFQHIVTNKKNELSNNTLNDSDNADSSEAMNMVSKQTTY
jgi:hypothetical protein